ncbi:MAG: phenylalanine--tRNA ligase subunit alpha [Acidimicrobiaceae bacterium]|nr:phenylalanine--tRNA ligase subunit alpha [Acidimicrobiaceae bacterium]
MIEGYEQDVADAEERLAAAADLDAVAGIERDMLGRRSKFTEAKRRLGELDAGERAAAGRRLNEARGRVEAAVAAARGRLAAADRAERYAAERLDLTERLDLAERLRPTERLHPAERLRLAERLRQQAVSSRGRFHPVTQARDRLEDVFVGMGYTVAEGPEVETAWYNFEALNIPDWHPARGSFDTIFVDLGAPEEVMLRSHTSPVQIRVMEKRKPPVYIVAPGRTFRTDTADATHLPAFNQIEGLAVDRNITMGDLAGTIDEFVRAFFGREVKSRLRPSYFPFTEPSAEFDISRPDGSWLELGGCGMVHPNVLSNCGIDPEEWQGFAFGFGIDRLAVMRHEIDDIREFVNSDTRFLSQF